MTDEAPIGGMTASPLRLDRSGDNASRFIPATPHHAPGPCIA